MFAGKADVFQGGVIPPTLRGFDPEYQPFPATADLAKAKALLAEAGVTGPIPFTVDVYNVPNAVASIQVIQQDWAAAGFEPTIQTHDLASFAKILLSKKFDMAISYEFNGTNWHKLGLSPLGVYTVDNFVNFVNFADPAYDELLASSRAEPDSDKQDAIWRQANQVIGDAAVNLIPVIPRDPARQAVERIGTAVEAVGDVVPSLVRGVDRVITQNCSSVEHSSGASAVLSVDASMCVSTPPADLGTSCATSR